MRKVITIIIAVPLITVALYFGGINLYFTEPDKETSYNRLEKAGGESYKEIVDRETTFMKGFLNQHGVIPFPDTLKIKQFQKELKKVFWWCWFVKSNHILKCFWLHCVSTVIKNQNLSNYPPDILMEMYVKQNPRAPYS